jgi:hypothetical protein
MNQIRSSKCEKTCNCWTPWKTEQTEMLTAPCGNQGEVELVVDVRIIRLFHLEIVEVKRWSKRWKLDGNQSSSGYCTLKTRAVFDSEATLVSRSSRNILFRKLTGVRENVAPDSRSQVQNRMSTQYDCFDESTLIIHSFPSNIKVYRSTTQLLPDSATQKLFHRSPILSRISLQKSMPCKRIDGKCESTSHANLTALNHICLEFSFWINVPLLVQRINGTVVVSRLFSFC